MPSPDLIFYIGEKVGSEINLIDFEFTSETLAYTYEVQRVLNLTSNSLIDASVF